VFSIAIVAAATISALNGALGQAVMPRLSKFAAEDDMAGMKQLYHKATQVACVIATPAVAVLTFFSLQILAAWTGKKDIAYEAAPILTLYAIGNAFASLNAFAYYLQYAKGNLRIHLAGNVLQVAIIVPLFFLYAKLYGPIGTGAVWAASNGLYFIFYMPIVHRRFLPGYHPKWLLSVTQICAPVMLVAWISSVEMPWATDRWLQFGQIFGTGLMLLVTAAICAPITRNGFLSLIWPTFKSSGRRI
jgi:O-antigen/teichoic acid export membrane protein